MKSPPLQEWGAAKTERNHLNLLSFLFMVYKVEVARCVRERERLDDARKCNTSPKQNHADPVLPSILAGKRFIFFQFCNNLYYLRLCPHSLPPQPLSNPCLESRGGREAPFTWVFNNAIREREAPKKYEPHCLCTWNGMACTQLFLLIKKQVNSLHRVILKLVSSLHKTMKIFIYNLSF